METTPKRVCEQQDDPGPAPEFEVVLSFLKALFGHEHLAARGHRIFICGARDWSGGCHRNPTDAAIEAMKLGGRDIYVGLATVNSELAPGHRMAAKHAAAICSLWADIDIAGPQHAKSALPPDQAAAIDLVSRSLPPPSLIVDTGHGVHAYWLFREPWIFENEEERARAAKLVKRFGETIQAEARRHGWTVDSVFDLARVFRLPGTINAKAEPKLARIIQCDGARYDPAEFVSYLADEAQLELGEDENLPRLRSTLLLTEDRAPSTRALTSMLADESRAEELWDHRCPDLRDDSPSGYDFALAVIAARRGWDDQSIADLLIAFRARHGLVPKADGHGVLRTDYYARTICAARAVAAAPEPAPDPAGSVMPRFPLTDLGNAQRLQQDQRGLLLFAHGINKFYIWDGARYREDGRGEATRRAITTIEGLHLEAARASNRTDRRAVEAWARSSQSASRIAACLELASSLDSIAVRADELDADPSLLNCPNGTVDLRTGVLRAHDPRDRITRSTPTNFDPSAVCPQWDRFLERVCGGDEDRKRFLQKWFGMCASGVIEEPYFVILYGRGANGKSVFCDVVLGAMGADYATHAPESLVSSSRFREHPTELMLLHGKRLAVASETETGSELRLSLVKRLTGESTITARGMRENYTTFRRTCKVILVTNNLPLIREESEAVWRRVVVVPFDQTIPRAEQDKGLAERILREEREGVLAWLVRGAVDALADGIDAPACANEITAAYRQTADPIVAFIKERCELAPGAWTSSRELFEAFATTGLGAGWSEKRFAQGLNAIDGVVAVRGKKGERGFVGICLRDAHAREGDS